MCTTTLALVVLSAIGFTAAVTFDWSDVQGKPGDSETIADFTQLHLSTFDPNGEAIHYVNGPITFTKELDESYNVQYNLLQKNQQSQVYEAIPEIPAKTVDFCSFVEQFFRSYLMPLTRYHHDFPLRKSKVCPVESGNYHIFPVGNREQLSAQSGLSPGEYKLEFEYQKDNAGIGMFSGTFVAKDD